MHDHDFYNGQPKPPTPLFGNPTLSGAMYLAEKMLTDAKSLRVTTESDGAKPDLQRCVNGRWVAWIEL